MMSCIPSPVEFKKLELATLNFLKSNATIQARFSQLSNDANLAYHRIEKASGGYDFESFVDVTLEGQNRRVFLGGRVEVKNNAHDNISYYLGVSKYRSRGCKLIRKIHFDYQPHSGHGEKPIFHLQYGGELSPLLKAFNCNDQLLQSYESKPRIPFMPMSLALLINILLFESQDLACSQVSGRREWQDLVTTNESTFWSPFFTQLAAKQKKRLHHWYAKA